MTKPTYGFNKLKGATITSVTVNAQGSIVVLTDQNGASYTIQALGTMNVTKASPRHTKPKPVKQPDEFVIPQHNHDEEYVLVHEHHTRSGLWEFMEKLLREQLGAFSGNIKSDVTLLSLGADDLDMVEIAMAVEDEYGITIPVAIDEQLWYKPLGMILAYLYTLVNPHLYK